MKLLIDLQGAQASNAKRGIGRYCVSLTEAIIRNADDHEVHLLLNERFVDTAIALRQRFSGVLPAAAIHSFEPCQPQPGAERSQLDQANEVLLAAVIGCIEPDAVLVTSLFEGFADDAVTQTIFSPELPTAVVLYDLIPLLFPSVYLTNDDMRKWYDRRVAALETASVLLSISESSRQDAVAHTRLGSERVVNISSAVDSEFSAAPAPHWASNGTELGVDRPFLLYAGGIDERKNITRLVTAFAELEAPLRSEYQLVIVCAVEAETRTQLLAQCADLGLADGDVVLTGYVSDDDLRHLYHLCTAFIFPSWYEGFGLPVLEAMSAGTAVIAANTSSLPEVVGRADAMFDPFSTDSISDAIRRVLTDGAFREDLATTGRERSKLFSWDSTARAALTALEAVPTRAAANTRPAGRPTLAYVSPLPPLPSGISDYSADLIPELAKYYDLELISTVEAADDFAFGHRVRSVEWFRTHHLDYDRVLYHVGNSEFHQHMFDLIAKAPGTVVLHDFYLSSIMAYMDATGAAPGAWATSLYHSHGYPAVEALTSEPDGNEVIWRYPANLQVLQDADGVIVHSEYSRQLAAAWYGESAGDTWTKVPLLRVPLDATPATRAAARRQLGLSENHFVVASFGMTGPTKLNHVLVDAFEQSALRNDQSACLFLVGENQVGEYGEELMSRLSAQGDANRFHCTGRVDPTTFRLYLLACDVAVQLRTNSRGETSAAILDCLNAGAALIANANGSQAELPADAVRLLPDDVSAEQLASSLIALRDDVGERQRLAAAGRALVRSQHQPSACAALYHEAIEQHARNPSARSNLQRQIAGLRPGTLSDEMVASLAAACAHSLPPLPRVGQLFVDVSELAARDAESGIQRVTKNVLTQLFASVPASLRVEPVAATATDGYRYARRFTERFLRLDVKVDDEHPIEFGPHDIFLGLDLQPLVIASHAGFFRRLRAAGTKVHFVVYDLLPLEIPDAFYPAAADFHTQWLRVVAEADGAVCISQAVANQLTRWVATHAPHRVGHIAISSFPLGADLSSSTPSTGYPDDAVEVLGMLAARPTFTMVGTIEPRKAHAQVLDGFERLWSAGVDVNLAIVGKPGWMVDDLLRRIEIHPERGNRLHWMNAASDEYLNSVYVFSDCLIAASWAEGFGLPLVEASLHHLPVIARDIQVFRELAGHHAHYFQGLHGRDVEVAVTEWLALQAEGEAESSEGIPCVTWQESAAQLLSKIVG